MLFFSRNSFKTLGWRIGTWSQKEEEVLLEFIPTASQNGNSVATIKKPLANNKSAKGHCKDKIKRTKLLDRIFHPSIVGIIGGYLLGPVLNKVSVVDIY